MEGGTRIGLKGSRGGGRGRGREGEPSCSRGDASDKLTPTRNSKPRSLPLGVPILRQASRLQVNLVACAYVGVQISLPSDIDTLWISLILYELDVVPRFLLESDPFCFTSRGIREVCDWFPPQALATCSHGTVRNAGSTLLCTITTTPRTARRREEASLYCYF